ncbi:conserved hypothetical protein [uncultured Dysgonomonas sp.]|uniref:Uncharacterized protein n=1 Tax=uncultured Dysgonomonas sp. TaxID=206096 RepID=A0A212J5P3_9BACT|nr:conserved hypothetical protein [uncultured Dysgonomonas sp.]
MILEHLRDGGMKTDNIMKEKKIQETGYNPSQICYTDSYSNKGYYETSATKNTVSEITKNKSIIVNTTIINKTF